MQTPPAAWKSFLAAFAATLAGACALAFSFAVVFDPFGATPVTASRSPVLMDLNQRYMYPQVVRSGQFDAAVVGTSTVRLIDPKVLDAALSTRFANLAMNSATAWEQTQILDLFLRHAPAAKAIVWGLDPLWCEKDATSPAKRLTPRPFPETFYDENRWNDWPELFNLKTLEIASRMMLYRVGLMPERYRVDGYEVFTPPETSYDLAQARHHLWGAAGPRPIVPQSPAFVETQAWRESVLTPALSWIDERLSRLPAGTRAVLLFPPHHVTAQPQPGSEWAASLHLCKQRVAAIAARHNATVLDFHQANPVTTDDSSYWDPLHYRLPIARRIEQAVIGALGAPLPASAPADGFWVVLAGGPPRR